MSDERTHREQFTDEEFAFLRHARFGELPAPVRPEEMVELSETEPPGSPPMSTEMEQEWRRLAWGA